MRKKERGAIYRNSTPIKKYEFFRKLKTVSAIPFQFSTPDDTKSNDCYIIRYII